MRLSSPQTTRIAAPFGGRGAFIMNIAYLISAHTDAPQLKRLIDALHKDAEYFIHIDKKSDITKFTSIIKGENIHFVENRENVRWGTIIEVFYQVELIEVALDYGKTFDRIFFLSGMDYPLWSNERITKYLESLGDKEILMGVDMTRPDTPEKQKDLYTTARPFYDVSFLSNKMNERLGILSRKILKALGSRKKLIMRNGWKLYKGSAWWCITPELARVIVDTFLENKAVAYYFIDSFGSAETFIQTVAFNTKFKSRCIEYDGPYPGLDALTPMHFIDYEPVIKVMDETDYDRLIKSDKMFTRKLLSGKSDKLVKLIENGRH